MDRFLLHIANAITLLSTLGAGLVLVSGFVTELGGEPAIGSYVLAGALAVVPYCFTGTLHRIVSIGARPD